MVAFDVGVTVPGSLIFHPARIDLHEANAAFDQSSGGQTLASEVVALLIADPVQILNMFGFTRQIQSFRSGRLHAIRQFEAFDSGCQF